jgi:hypothetical protein
MSVALKIKYILKALGYQATKMDNAVLVLQQYA